MKVNGEIIKCMELEPKSMLMGINILVNGTWVSITDKEILYQNRKILTMENGILI